MKKVWLVLMVNILLGVSQFILISLVSTDGEEVWKQRQAQTAIEAKNQTLKQNIFSLSSLPQVELRAKELGLGPLKADFWRGVTVAQAKP